MEQAERLQKVLAGAGLGSRRTCEAMIAAGRVSIDGQVVRQMGVKIVPGSQRIAVDGAPIQLDDSKLTLALHKPTGVLSTMQLRQADGRPTVGELVEARPERLFHVGRLDADTEGLLLLTNDGELANRLTHPAHQVPKTYVATVEGRVPAGLGRRLRAGVELDDGFAKVDSFKILEQAFAHCLVEVVIHSGRNRIVRRLLGQSGFPVTRLVRTRVGPVRLGDLKPGRYRRLGQAELSALMRDLGM
jgi:23S rRNA pseudouridine2605 synthase